MSRLPDLERALFDAATRLDADELPNAELRPAAIPPARDHARRWRRRSTPLLAGVASLLVAAGAVAAVSGLLADGDPVPSAPASSPLRPVAGNASFSLASLRVPDPDGGPPWAIGTYVARSRVTGGNMPASMRAQARRPVTCVTVGRVQAGQLGVVGRDGVFGNDRRFHRLSPAALSSGFCGGSGAHGPFVSMSLGPPIPASAYTGPPGTRIGGCRERVNLNGPTVSPQTRRRLRGVPECSVGGLRRVIAGFAGPRAETATLVTAGSRKTLRLQAKENGAYLFVVRSASGGPVGLSITDGEGTVCRPFAVPRSRPGRPPMMSRADAEACSRLARP